MYVFNCVHVTSQIETIHIFSWKRTHKNWRFETERRFFSIAPPVGFWGMKIQTGTAREKRKRREMERKGRGLTYRTG